jgi:hypothetical protein
MGLADHEDRHRGVAQHRLGHGAEEEPSQAGAAVRGHGDEIGPAFLGGRQDLVGRPSASDRPGRVHALRDASAGIGWVEARALGPRRTVMVKPEMAEVRSAPEATAPVAFRVGRRVLLEWVENLPSGWVRVRHAEGGTGYVRSADVFGA